MSMIYAARDLAIRPNLQAPGLCAYSATKRRFEPLTPDEVAVIGAMPVEGIPLDQVDGGVSSWSVPGVPGELRPIVERLLELGILYRVDDHRTLVPGARTKIPVYLYNAISPFAGELQFFIPLSLGLIIESARIWQHGELADAFDLEIPVIDSPVRLLEAIEARGPGIVLFSDYMWTIEENLAVSGAVRALFPTCITMHGGPSVPKYQEPAEQWLREHRHVDVAVRGEGELTAAEVLGALRESVSDVYGRREGAPKRIEARHLAPLAKVLGLTYAWTHDGERHIVRTEDRPRLDDPGSIPSPIVTGFFDGKNARPWTLGILETNRGCPYGCTYCDWGSATLQKIKQYPLDRVRGEVEWYGRHQVRYIFLSDANFGILPRDIEVAQVFVDVKQDYGYPRSVMTNYAKNGSLPRLAEIFRIWQDGGVAFDAIISIQTMDEQVLKDVRRSNIQTEKYHELSDLFEDMRIQGVIQVMLALPGSTIDSVCRDLEHFFLREQECQAFLTQVLPNAPLADPAYIARHKIVTKNDYIVSSYSFTEDDWLAMSRIAVVYRLVAAFRLLAHYLMWLHLDCGIAPISGYVRSLVADMDGDRLEAYPALEALLAPLRSGPIDRLSFQAPAQLAAFVETGWGPFLADAQRYAAERFGVPPCSASETLALATDAVLPRAGRTYPHVVELPHDLASFLNDHRKRGAGRRGPLSSYPAATLQVDDPLQRSVTPPQKWISSLMARAPAFELPSALRDLRFRADKVEDYQPKRPSPRRTLPILQGQG